MVIQQSPKGMAERELKANRPPIKTRLSLQSHWGRADRCTNCVYTMLQSLPVNTKSPHHAWPYESCPTPYLPITVTLLFLSLSSSYPLDPRHYLLTAVLYMPQGPFSQIPHRSQTTPAPTGPLTPGLQRSHSYNFAPFPPEVLPVPLSWPAGWPACLPTAWLCISPPAVLCVGRFPGNRPWQGSRAERSPCTAAAC